MKFVSSGNILLTPSRNEGCSMLVLQSLRSGSILMVGDYPHNNRELVEKGNCGFALDHRSPKIYADKLIDIISHPHEYVQLYENAHRTFEDFLSYPVWEASMENLIEEASYHTERKRTISDKRLTYDIMRMKILRKKSYYRSIFFFTIRSLCNFYIQYFKMRLMGDFPLKTNKYKE